MAKKKRNNAWRFIFFLGVTLSLLITYYYFKYEHWGWGLLPIPSFFVGFLGIIIIPIEFHEK